MSVTVVTQTLWCPNCRKVVNATTTIERGVVAERGHVEMRKRTESVCENGHFIQSVSQPVV